MRRPTLLALAALGLAASALPAAAGTLLVPQQYPTIQKALNAAKPYDTVLVSPKSGGRAYSEAVTVSKPHVTLQGCNGPVIDGSKLGTVVHFLPGFPQFDYTVFPNGIEIRADHVSVCGMTVQNFAGSVQPDTGAGINVGAFVATGDFTGGEVSFSDVVISGNTLRNNGEGLKISGYTGSDPYNSGAGAYLKGYQVLGNTLSNNGDDGALIDAASVLVAGNKAAGNGGYGLDVTGLGAAVSGNEAAGNGAGLRVIDAAYTYDPSVNNPKNPNPAPTVTALNYIHDNAGDGIDAQGTQTISGNVVANSVRYGVYLSYADYSCVSGNVITGTALSGYSNDDGTGIFAEFSADFSGGDSKLKVSLNQVGGNAGDGIYFYDYAGGVISFNSVTGNKGIGIHLSDYTYQYDGAPTTVTQNSALHNALFDARDDASATDHLDYNGGTDGDGVPTLNVWTRNLFGTTDPVGLSR